MLIKNITTLLFLFCGLLLSRASMAYSVDPDKFIAKAGDWNVYLAIYGTDCIAQQKYQNGYTITFSLGYKSFATLIIEVNPSDFVTKLDGRDSLDTIELLSKFSRRGVTDGLEPYGFRGTPGIVYRIDFEFILDVVSSKFIRISEFGKEVVRLKVGDLERAIDEVVTCMENQ